MTLTMYTLIKYMLTMLTMYTLAMYTFSMYARTTYTLSMCTLSMYICSYSRCVALAAHYTSSYEVSELLSQKTYGAAARAAALACWRTRNGQ